MDKIDSFEQINILANDIRSLHKGYLTNFFLDKKKHSIWIQKGTLFYISFPSCHFLLHLTESVNNLFFITINQEQLTEGLKRFLPMFPEQLVVDIVGDEKIVSIKRLFIEQGFYEYETLYRMNHVGTLEYSEISDSRVVFAKEEDAHFILDMLHSFFNQSNCLVMKR